MQQTRDDRSDPKEEARAPSGLKMAAVCTIRPSFRRARRPCELPPSLVRGAVFGNTGAYNLGPERSSRSQVVGEFLRAGANVTLSSDVVSEAESYRAAPFLGMQMSVTRCEYDDPTGPGWSPASASLVLQGAIEAYTLSGCAPTRARDSLRVPRGRQALGLRCPGRRSVRGRHQRTA
jgi:hypothetical protein